MKPLEIEEKENEFYSSLVNKKKTRPTPLPAQKTYGKISTYIP